MKIREHALWETAMGIISETLKLVIVTSRNSHGFQCVYKNKNLLMDHLTVYEEYDVETAYIGKPIACDIHFKNRNGDIYALTIYDNDTYCITYPAHREYKRVNVRGIEFNDEKFNSIDPGFKSWLTAQLQQHYEL